MKNEKVAIFYLLNDKGRKIAIEKDLFNGELQMIVSPMTKELLDLCEIDSQGNGIITVGFVASSESNKRDLFNYMYQNEVSYDFKYYMQDKVTTGFEIQQFSQYSTPSIKKIVEYKRFGDIQTLESLIKYKKNEDFNLKEAKKNIEKQLEDKLKIFEENKKIELKEKEDKQKENEKAKMEREQKQREELEIMLNWIEEHGSSYLKTCVDLGYDFEETFIKEKARMEIPNFDLDFEGRYEFEKTTKPPSEELLDEVVKLIEKGYEAEVSVLTYDSEYEYEQGLEFVTIDFHNVIAVKF